MKDYGFNPLGNGQWELVPSKKIVDKKGLEEFLAQRSKTRNVINDCFGMSWDEIEAKQGGNLNVNL